MNQRDTQRRREQQPYDDVSRSASGSRRSPQRGFGSDEDDDQMGDYYTGSGRQMRSGDMRGESYDDDVGSNYGGLRSSRGPASYGMEHHGEQRYGDRYGSRYGGERSAMSSRGGYAGSGGPGYGTGYGMGHGMEDERSGYERRIQSARGGMYGRDDDQFDPDYRQWREEQMRSLDRDYHDWRAERYKKFSDEFGQWRGSRSAGAGNSSSGGSGAGTSGGTSGGTSPGSTGTANDSSSGSKTK